MINTKTQAGTSRKDNIAAKSYAKIVESKFFSSNNDLPGMFPRRVIDGNNIAIYFPKNKVVLLREQMVLN